MITQQVRGSSFKEQENDGGAYPEIHNAQFPLNLGKTASNPGTTTSTIPLTVNKYGEINYNALARVGHSKDTIIYSSYSDQKEKNIDEGEAFTRPSEEELVKTTEETRTSLEKIVQGKISSVQPKTVNVSSKNATFIRYVPSNQQGPAFNSGSKERIIKMVEQQVDPMDPAKFKHKRIPRPPPSPPAPVLHSPPRRATVADQKAWTIPPSISNWKNPKGYTIPLEKRLASDGRGLQEIVINENFALFSEALYIAESHSRQEVESRNALEKKLAEKERRQKEETLRLLAQKSREERAGFAAASGAIDQDYYSNSHSRPDDFDEDSENISSIQEREALRKEKAKERERELRLSRMGSEQKSKVLSKEKDRDISEKIALGIAQPTYSKDTLFDQRLFNQSEGMSSGFGASDSYDLYDKALFSGSSANIIYKPSKDLDNNNNNNNNNNREQDYDAEIIGSAHHPSSSKIIKNHGKTTTENEPRLGPVLFEKSYTSSESSSAPADPFGLDVFLKEAKLGKKPSSSSEEHQEKHHHRHSPPHSSSSSSRKKNKYLKY